MAGSIVEKITKCVTNITEIDEDYEYPGVYPIQSIQFVPGGIGVTGDEIFVRDGSITGAIIFHALTVESIKWGQTKQYIKYFHGENYKPVICFADCTLSGGHVVIIEKR